MLAHQESCYALKEGADVADEDADATVTSRFYFLLAFRLKMKSKFAQLWHIDGFQVFR